MVDAVLAVAAEVGSSPVHVSLAWLRQRSAVASTAMVPILGPRTPEHLEEYLRSLDLTLDHRRYQHLDEVSAVRLGAPHEDVAAAISHGLDGDRSLLDTHTTAI